jgi:hypothetical protein
MGGLTLLRKAREAGLRVEALEGRLRVTGPKQCEALAQAILAQKTEIITILALGNSSPWMSPGDLPPDWRIEWEERAAIREHEGGQAREHAEAEALREIVQRMRDAGHRI